MNSYDFLTIFFSLDYFSVRIQSIHISHTNMCYSPFMLSVRLIVNSRLLLVKV